MEFIIRGQGYQIDKRSVMEAVKGVEPNPTDERNKYYVEISRQRYPIKQLIHLTIGLPYVAFTAADAYRILRKLEFEINSFEENVKKPLSIAHAGDTIKLAITIEQDEDDYYVTSCPALPGCHSQGRTRQEAVANIKEAIRGYIASMRKHGEPIPSIKDVEKVEVAV